MFKIIEPKYQCFYKPLIEHFIESIRLYSSFEFLPQIQNRTTFILGENKEKGARGGAMIFKKKLCDCPQELVHSLTDYVSLQEEIWECLISLSFYNDNPLYTTGEGETFCQIFYRNLYDKLAEFGQKEKTGFLCVSLDSGEYYCTEGLISWPYVFEFKPRGTSDGFFHGILSLTGSQYEAYKNACQALDFSLQECKLKLHTNLHHQN